MSVVSSAKSFPLPLISPEDVRAIKSGFSIVPHDIVLEVSSKPIDIFLPALKTNFALGPDASSTSVSPVVIPL